eukprot:TRINITY_DN19274_c0_g1_i1.p1 TRINITY_DN19274_c0_g1~~TRINITY_DN19274_c0_g1_i1.p1  ORF type:complete len:248 (+),score=80.25 TRINITY_DN19274_c0_g1_i1:50-793(+)
MAEENKNAEYLKKLDEVTALSMDQQTNTFLRAFVHDFQGKFEQVLDVVEDFKTYVKRPDGQLDEAEAHYFLEKKGEAATVIAFREKMRAIDLDFNKRVSVIEYLLYKYKKTLKELFEAKPNAALIKKLEEAIEQYRAVFRAKKEREDKIAQLEATISGGGPNAAKAKSELMNLKSHDSAKDGADEISALAAKLKAKRALANPGEHEDTAYKEEQARLAEEERKKEAEEKKKQDDSRNRLKERSKLWQ